MKYKVGDRVKIIDRINGHGLKIGSTHKITAIYSNENLLYKIGRWLVSDTEVCNAIPSPDYRALYEQEKALREAAEKMLCDQADMTIDEWMEAFNNYQQLKQKYGQDT